MKYFRFTPEYALWGISFTNLMMMVLEIPHRGTGDEKGEKPEEITVEQLKNLI